MYTREKVEIGNLIRIFYVIESVSALLINNMGFVPFKHSHEKWRSDFDEFSRNFVSSLARLLFDYTALVVAGEIRHCDRRADHEPREYISFVGSYSRDYVYNIDAKDYDPQSLLRLGEKVFDEHKVSWRYRYGGDKWRIISKAGLMYGKVPDSVFIDHCVDLTHNGSIYFDKGAGLLYLEGGNQNFNEYLDYLDMKKMASPRAVIRKTFCISSEMFSLLRRGIDMGILPIEDYGVRGPRWEKEARTEDGNGKLLFPHPVDWGTRWISTALAKNANRFDEYGERIYRDEDEDEEDEE